MRLTYEGSPDPAADGGVPEFARVPRQGSPIETGSRHLR